MNLFDAVMFGLAGLNALLTDIAHAWAPYAVPLMVVSGVLFVLLLVIKFTTQRGRHLFASLLFMLSVFVISAGIHFASGFPDVNHWLSQHLSGWLQH